MKGIRPPSTVNKPPNPPSLIQYKNMSFLIFDAPSDQNLDVYIKELQSHNVTEVVRVCEPTYDKAQLEAVGIKVYEWPFPDGDAPPTQIVNDWLSLVHRKFEKKSNTNNNNKNNNANTNNTNNNTNLSDTIGVHCVAGLGRAPVLVAMALIEGGMAPLDSVIYIRERRRGAINARQLKYLEVYKKHRKEKACIIS